MNRIRDEKENRSIRQETFYPLNPKMSIDLTHLPHSPGVYLMRDRQAKIIYIGKAIDLKKRVASYFQNRPLSTKLVALLSTIQHIDYIPTASERESLILEQKLIQRFQPLYNTMWRDDKSYPYIKLTMNEDYPRLFLTRQKINDGSSYFGPYPNVQIVKRLIHTLWRKKVFALRPCRFPFREKDIFQEGGLEKSQPALYRKVRACIYLHTGECPAPCVGRISKTEYRKIADRAELFFEGQFNPLKTQLEKEMKSASKNLNFELASQVRDQLSALGHLSERVTLKKINEETVAGQTQMSRALSELQDKLRLPRPPLRIEAFDISNIQGSEPVGSMVIFENGKSLKSEYRKYKIKTVKGPDDFAMMKEVVKRRYRRVITENKKIPDLILIDGGKGQLSAAINALNELKKNGLKVSTERLPVASLAKQNEEIFLPNQSRPVLIPKDSPALHLLQAVRDEAHRFAVTFHRQRRDKITLSKNL